MQGNEQLAVMQAELVHRSEKRKKKEKAMRMTIRDR
jgi:hypothetical protein